MLIRGLILVVIVAFIGPGCQSAASIDRSERPATPHTKPPRGGQAAITEVVAYVAGEPVATAEVFPPLIEAAGAEVLGDRVLLAVLRRRLAVAEIELGPQAIEAERQVMLRSLAQDPDEAARLLRELRARRGWGEVRFAQLLETNAGLRAMVADRVEVTDAAVQREFRLRYGPASRVRLITVPRLSDAQRLSRAAAAGESFAELAALHSTDPSAASGGLLSPIRPDDTSYPDTLRAAVTALDEGQVSAPLGLDGQFALLKLEEQLPGTAVEFKEVESALKLSVRARAERVLMQQLARELVGAADVVVLDPTLKALWETQRKALLQQP